MAAPAYASSSANRAYLGKPKDPAFGFQDLGNRWYDPGTQRFLSIDPVFWEVGKGTEAANRALHSSQAQNPTSYAGGNPVSALDPDGRYTVTIDGTNLASALSTGEPQVIDFSQAMSDAKTRSFDQPSYDAVLQSYPDSSGRYKHLVWAGGDTKQARSAAATVLQDELNGLTLAPGEPLNIIGFSHGGSVALEALGEGYTGPAVTNLVLVGTPVRSDYPNPPSSVAPSIRNIYSPFDIWQTLGGSLRSRLLAGKYRFGATVMNIPVTPMSLAEAVRHPIAAHTSLVQPRTFAQAANGGQPRWSLWGAALTVASRLLGLVIR